MYWSYFDIHISVIISCMGYVVSISAYQFNTFQCRHITKQNVPFSLICFHHCWKDVSRCFMLYNLYMFYIFMFCKLHVLAKKRDHSIKYFRILIELHFLYDSSWIGQLNSTVLHHLGLKTIRSWASKRGRTSFHPGGQFRVNILH